MKLVARTFPPFARGTVARCGKSRPWWPGVGLALTFVGCVLLLTPAAFAQGTVTIYGTVSDKGGGIVPGAEVTVTNTLTGASRTIISNETGGYVAGQLPVGVYQVRVQLQGFKSFVQDQIQVQVDENRQVNIVLEVGELTESVAVRAEVTQVEFRSGSLRDVVDSQRIVALPLNGRNPLQLTRLVAGSGGVAAKDQGQNETVSINGARTNSNNYQLDGGDNHDPYFNAPAVFPNPDALDEFSLQTNSYGADRGRNAGAFMTAVTKSGTNQFHGSVFEYFRDASLNAKNYFSTTVPPFERNQYGGTFGGPIVRNRTFFFGSFQGTNERSAPGAVTATVPTEAQRRGDFSASKVTLKDPRGGTFPGNIIPADRLNAASQQFLQALVPLPNAANGLLTTVSEQEVDDYQFVVKLDHRFSDSNTISGRLLRNETATQEATGNLPGFFASIDYQNWNVAVTDTHIFSSSVVNTFVFAYNKIDRRQIPVVPGDQTWNTFGAGFTRAFEGDAPASMHTQVDGYFNAFSRFPLNHFRQNYQFSNTVSWSKGAHFLRFGADVRRQVLDMQELFRGDPFVRFGNTWTGEAAADLMLGLPAQFEQIAEAKNAPQTWELGVFVQDDWKASRDLTLNLGFRWDPWFPFVDEFDKFAQHWPGEQSTKFPGAPAGVLYPGDNGLSRSMLDPAWDSVAPRVGFAWDPVGDGKMSIRGAYGLFYSQVRQQANNQIATNQPFSLKLTVNNPPGGVNNPYLGVGDPFPFKAPTNAEEAMNYKWVLPLTLTQWNPDMRNAVIQQWNVNVQREVFSNWIATVAYVGSKGDHLFMSAEKNPGVYGVPGTLNQRRIYAPNFAQITDMSSQGNSDYHALQVSVNKRLSQGFSVLANYTWSQLMDDSSGDGDQPNNPFDFSQNWGPSSFDIPHRFVASFVWQLPSLAGSSAPIRYIFGDWETNGIISLQSGRGLSAISGRDNSQSGTNQDRADIVGDWQLPSDRSRDEAIAQWFNIAAFAQNAPGTFGTSGRNIVRGPGEATVDFGLVKSIPFSGSWKMQFRAEFFNLLNTVNLGNPNMNASSAQFGRITSAGNPRVIQLALRLMF